MHGLAADDMTPAGLSRVDTRTFCLRGLHDNRSDYRFAMSIALRRAPPRVQQLAVSVQRLEWEKSAHVFQSATGDANPFSHLLYLDFLDGLAHADLTYLLTLRKPPAFAAQHNHLALRVHWEDRTVAAGLLSSRLGAGTTTNLEATRSGDAADVV